MTNKIQSEQGDVGRYSVRLYGNGGPDVSISLECDGQHIAQFMTEGEAQAAADALNATTPPQVHMAVDLAAGPDEAQVMYFPRETKPEFIPPQEAVMDGATDPAAWVRYDLSGIQNAESAIHKKLVELGWMPPGTQEPAMCSSCAGEGKALDGGPCICGGAGTEYAAAQGLRVLVHQLLTANDEAVRLFVDRLKSMQAKKINRALEEGGAAGMAEYDARAMFCRDIDEAYDALTTHNAQEGKDNG